MMPVNQFLHFSRRMGFGLVAACVGISTLISIQEARAAGSFRVLIERNNQVTDPTDDFFESVKLQWDDDDPAVSGGILYHIATTQIGATEIDEIVPISNNLLGLVNQAEVREGFRAAYDSWNEADADISIRNTLRYDYSASVIDPVTGFLGRPTFAAVDRINLITFQEPTVDLGGVTDDGTVLGVALVTYFNQDYDMSNFLDLPDEVISTFGGDIDGYATTFATVDFDQDGVPDVIVPARDWEAGTIFDSDIVFNSAVPQWQQYPQSESELTELEKLAALGQSDVQGVLTHELGHTLGLAHTQLLSPTMTPFLTETTYPYDFRSLDFDDIISLRMGYSYAESGLGGGIIEGRIVDGATEDGFGFSTIGESIQNAAVFIGRPSNESRIADDDLAFDGNTSAIDDTTSVPNKIRLLASVLNGSDDYSFPGGINAPRGRNNSRYIVPGLPPTDQPFQVSPEEFIPAGPYVVWVQDPLVPIVDDVSAELGLPGVPQEFYGGTVPWLQPGSQPVASVNTPGDRLVQDGWIQLGSTLSGMPGVRIPNSNHTLVGFWDAVPPVTSFLTFRIVDGTTVTDLTNIGAGDLSGGPMIEDASGLPIINGSFESSDRRLGVTLRYEIGKYRSIRTEQPPTDARLVVTLTNQTTRPLQLGSRFTLLTALKESNNVSFWLPDGTEITRETVLSGGDVPSYLFYAPDNYPPVLPVLTLDNANVTRPSRIVMANADSLGVNGLLRFDYPAANAPINGAAFASIYDPIVVQPGESRTVSIAVGYVRQRTFVDGPVEGTGFPGADAFNFYRPLTLDIGQRLSGIDILTNTGLPGGLLAIPGEGEGPGNPTAEDQDGDGVLDTSDNCPLVFNPDQLDRDFDGIGDACDPDSSLQFIDISPNAAGSGIKNGVPSTPLTTLGATFGDVNNDGFPDLVLANTASAEQSPESAINRLYLNIPAATSEEPGARRLVDVSFGINGRPQSNEEPGRDDRMPFDLDGSSHIILADFDNDGDLDMYISNFGRPNNPVIGAQNRFYRNDDVDDPSINPAPDSDDFGDGFFRDVTLEWDPGILNVGAFVPYEVTYTVGGGTTFSGGGLGFDISSKSATGDIDNDGDLDIIVSNQNIFGDLSGTDPATEITGLNFGDNSTDGSRALLRFSERILINRSREPANEVIPNNPRVGGISLFTDETLGADSLFGGEIDRMPPLMPEWPTQGAPGDLQRGESDFSLTQQVILTPYLGNNNALGIVVFNQRVTPSSFHRLDGNDLVFDNTDGQPLYGIPRDGVPDGVFVHRNYGSEPFLEIPGVGEVDGETTIVLRAAYIGIPDGYTNDTVSPELDRKFSNNDQSIGGGVQADINQDGWPELISFNAVADHSMFTNFESPIQLLPADRTRMSSFGLGVTLSGIDTFERAFIRSRAERFGLTVTGRPRGAIVTDLNLDGLPDIVVANDTNQITDFTNSTAGPGFPTFWLNFDNWGMIGYTNTTLNPLNLSNSVGSSLAGEPLVSNGTARRSLSVAAADIDLDGDTDLFFGNGGEPGTFLKNQVKLAGLPPTVEPGADLTAASQYDLPLFVDASHKYVDPYLGTLFEPTNPGDQFRTANSTIGAKFADFNGDGFLDMAPANGGIGAVDGEFQQVFRNNGFLITDASRVFMPFASQGANKTVDSAVGSPNAITNVPAQAYDVLAADFSGDGFSDLIYISANSPARYFLNTDADEPTDNSIPDGDSLPDGRFEEINPEDERLWVGPDGQQFNYPNIGDRIPDNYDSRRFQSRRAAVADFDGDGQLDFVVSNGLNQGAPNVIWMNRSTGGGIDSTTFEDQSDVRFPQFRYRNQSNGSFTGETGPVLDDTFDVLATDVDNDGDIDIVFINRQTLEQTGNLNLFPHCRLLINNPSNAPGLEGFFAEVTNSASAGLFVPAPALGGAGVIVDEARWPLAFQILNEAFAGLSGNLTGLGERGEDRNGNRTVRGSNQSIDDAEDLNNDRTNTFNDANGNGRHDFSMDIVVLTRGTTEPNPILINQDRDGDGFGDGFFVDDTANRFASYVKLPSQGGDIGDVNDDGINDLVLAVNTQGTFDQGPQQKVPAQLFVNSGGKLVDVSVFTSSNAPTSSALSVGQYGEMPLLKVQFADSNSAMRLLPGNAFVARLVDVDRDGDLDMFIGQGGRLDTQTRVGYSNHMLINMQRSENQNSRSILSFRDGGGPVITNLLPAAAIQGRMQPVEVHGINISEGATFNFGAGVSVVANTLSVSVDRSRATMVLVVDENATPGPRQVRVTNPDTQFHQISGFRIISKSLVPQAEAAPDWMLYE